MKSTARSLLIAAAAIGLVAFTMFSVFAASAVTPIAVGSLTIAALTLMTVKSYAPRPARRPRVALAPVATEPASARRMPTLVRVPAVVEYARRRDTVRAA